MERSEGRWVGGAGWWPGGLIMLTVGCGARAAECWGWLHCVGSSTPHSLQTRGQHNTCHHHVGIVGSKGTVEMNWVTSACPNIEGGCI